MELEVVGGDSFMHPRDTDAVCSRNMSERRGPASRHVSGSGLVVLKHVNVQLSVE